MVDRLCQEKDWQVPGEHIQGQKKRIFMEFIPSMVVTFCSVSLRE